MMSNWQKKIAQLFPDVVVNVKDFGATGDGVTDDTAAIQNAVLMASGQQKIVFFPVGQYIISDTIDMQNSAGIVGSGRNLSLIVWKGNDSTKDAIIVSGLFKIIRDIGIRNGENYLGHSFLNISGLTNTELKNINLIGCQSDNTVVQYGIYVDSSSSGYYNFFENVAASGFGKGLLYYGGNITQNIFLNCRFGSNHDYGAYVGGHKAIFIGCFFESNSDIAFYSTYGEIILLGNYFEGNAGADILTSYQTGSVILGNRINVKQTKDYAVRCLSSGDALHRGVQIASNTIWITSGTLSCAFDLSGQIRMSNNSVIENGGTLTNLISKGVGVTINDVGESSDSGAPTSDLWERGSIVHQTGDNTWWIKGIDGNWAQIA